MRKIKNIIITLVLIFLSEIACSEQLKFVQVTDCHLSLDGSNYQGRNIEESQEILEKTVDSINKLNDIDFVIFSGDNIDVANKKNLIKFFDIVNNLNKPYYLAIGDHDVYRNRGFSKKDYIKIIRQYNINQKKCKKSYYYFYSKNFMIIVMDGVADHFFPSSHGYYPEDELEWLDKTLKREKNEKVIIIQHFPLIEPYESISHYTKDADLYFDLLDKYKNVFALLSGHYHGGGKENVRKGVHHINTPALVNPPHNYRIIEVDYEKPEFTIKTNLIPLMP